MAAVFCCLLLLPFVAAAQTKPHDRAASADAIAAGLSGLNTAGAARASIQRQIAEAIMSAAEADQQPSRSTVAHLVDELTAALAGRKLQRTQTTGLAQCLVDLVRPSGVSTTLIAIRTRDLLTAAGVDAPKITLVVGKLVAVGEEVRGPDDLGIRE